MDSMCQVEAAWPKSTPLHCVKCDYGEGTDNGHEPRCAYLRDKTFELQVHGQKSPKIDLFDRGMINDCVAFD